MSTVSHVNCAVTALISVVALTGCFGEPEYLSQNWNEGNGYREQSYHTSQGSQLIPYDWFLYLQAPNSKHLLRDDITIERLRYLPDYTPDPLTNPDSLPIGFVKDVDAKTGDWIGINCSACHTAQIVFEHRVMRIDGAPSMGDYAGLLKTVRDSLEQTLKLNLRFKRFEKNLSATGEKISSEKLRQEIQASIVSLDVMIKNSTSSEHVPGFGRIDAFGAIRNEVFVTDLGVAENFEVPSAPVSYPFLWDAPHLDRVQWVGNVENTYARNAGQVLGVMGRLDLQNLDSLFSSSIRRDNLFFLEEWLKDLTAPQWPEGILGGIDHDAAARGEALYVTPDFTGNSCVDCHSLKNENNQYPLTDKNLNAFGKQFIKTYNTPLSEIGTDPNTIENIYSSTPMSTGVIGPALGGPSKMMGAELLSIITGGAVQQLFQQAPRLSQEQQVIYSGFKVNNPSAQQPVRPVGYKARPLAGIWATSPYLHNGSVPNLFELLLPPENRSQSFWVGNMSYNNRKVGYSSRYRPGSFRFDTTLSGNRNTGHLYGTQLSNQERWDMVEFLKTL